MTQRSLTPATFDRLRAFIETKTGIAVADGKSYLVETRFASLLDSAEIDSFEALCDRLESGASAVFVDKLVNAITTNETLWFRDEGPWEILRRNLLPAFCESLRSGGTRRIRIWSAACSTGQEPYSVAMVIRDFLDELADPALKPEAFEIVATDLSSDAIATARAGEYELLAASRGITPDLLDRFFEVDGSTVQVSPEIRDMVKFDLFDLQRSFAGRGKFDLILCRNVLIYFSNALKLEIYEKMSSTLNEGGALVLGGAESIQGSARLFKMARAGRHVYYTPKVRGDA